MNTVIYIQHFTSYSALKTTNRAYIFWLNYIHFLLFCLQLLDFCDAVLRDPQKKSLSKFGTVFRTLRNRGLQQSGESELLCMGLQHAVTVHFIDWTGVVCYTWLLRFQCGNKDWCAVTEATVHVKDTGSRSGGVERSGRLFLSPPDSSTLLCGGWSQCCWSVSCRAQRQPSSPA